ncbi:YdbL family protein [Sphingomonas sp. LaA6.9]|uniref:YdbL family protein n=1 Tax=Sphingomonas sp. LaA6.9 TaxID=2919914 RepID=UPI001F4F9B3C|nr:YdbL family protein [Sphingomonas sp. LaA6.9]MCJ8159865.1 YdbL family protein [Sphingomonas sp. LaA6.9]
MTKNRKIIIGLGVALVLTAGVAGVARAQSGAVSAALASGDVGEQADGYLGFRNPPSAALKAEVDAINIKRRAAYTDLAAKRGVSVSDMAAATGCQTLTSKVGPGRAYRLTDGVWRVREGSAPVPKPDYCPSVG